MAGTPLHESLTGDGVNTFYSEELRVAFEQHIPFLLSGNRSTLIDIKPIMAYQNEYDFNSLLLALQIPYYAHWITMRLNGLTHPSEYTRDMLKIFLPDFELLEKIKSLEMTILRVDS